MALYHFSVKQVSRGKGQTVVNSAAYISGQKLYNDYYGQTHDYTKKSGVVFTEILTPEYVPERLTDRETLWNEVEKVEKSKRAQLAYSFDIALQNELTLDENIELARAFCWEQFVARGMIVDLAVHEGKSKNEDEPDNPHFHVLRGVARAGRDDSHLFLGHDLRDLVGKRAHQHDVDAERLVGQPARGLDLPAQVVGVCVHRGDDAEAARLGNGAGELSVGNPRHAALKDRVTDPENVTNRC